VHHYNFFASFFAIIFATTLSEEQCRDAGSRQQYRTIVEEQLSLEKNSPPIQ
jgi:hypothetical protein